MAFGNDFCLATIAKAMAKNNFNRSETLEQRSRWRRENQFGNNCDEKLGKTVLTGEIGHRFAEWSLIGIKI